MGTFVTNISIDEFYSDFTGTGDPAVDIWLAEFDLTDPNADNEVVGVFVLDNAQDRMAEVGDVDFSFGGFTEGSEYILFPSFDPDTGTFAFEIDRDAIIAAGETEVVIEFTVTGTGTGLVGQFTSDEDTVRITVLVCFARGTMIATANGERPVESLRVGDHVLTDDGRNEEIRWIGSREVKKRELEADPSLSPVRISAEAFGKNLPKNDLLVSQQHRIKLQDANADLLFGSGSVLVPAKGLVNGSNITFEKEIAEIEYFHIAFDEHEVLLTNGLPTESFHPGPTYLSSADVAAAEELFKIFPNLENDFASFGPSCLPSLKVWEAKLLAEAIGLK
ncbi:Hint domain-containing protein [Ruegeria atlantica]|uniref:Hedgehog/Intein (Hint) domain-containing protein n=1 Tax=Ruegeria atlantica TaxID=81569 RepID=A0A0P1E8K9_9RHOB|nr:Hint domain-containing protein [Ruegeria atlantica]CUH45451.1 hypothetical protein RUM4293_04366 [Ruegeria atlantica]